MADVRAVAANSSHFTLIRVFSSLIYRAGRGQLLGATAQLLAALPILVASVMVARIAGLEALAQMTALSGISVVLYTLSLLGLRTRLVLDRFQTVPLATYIQVRALMGAVMLCAIGLVGLYIKADPLLVLSIGLFRAGDMALDLILAVDQVRLPEDSQLYGFLSGGVIKFSAVLVAIGFAFTSPLTDPFKLLIAAACAYLFAVVWLVALRRGMLEEGIIDATSHPLRNARKLIHASAVFMVAQAVCACVTAFPRFALSWSMDSHLAGVVGAALTTSTIVGMVYYAVWLRWAPKLFHRNLTIKDVSAFIAEILILSMAGMIATVLFGAKVTALIYGIEGAEELQLIEVTLLWSFFFFFAMTIANLFKPTAWPWAESAVYLSGLGAAALLHILVPTAQIWNFMAVIAIAMLCFEICFVTILNLKSRWQQVRPPE